MNYWIYTYQYNLYTTHIQKNEQINKFTKKEKKKKYKKFFKKKRVMQINYIYI